MIVVEDDDDEEDGAASSLSLHDAAPASAAAGERSMPAAEVRRTRQVTRTAVDTGHGRPCPDPGSNEEESDREARIELGLSAVKLSVNLENHFCNFRHLFFKILSIFQHFFCKGPFFKNFEP